MDYDYQEESRKANDRGEKYQKERYAKKLAEVKEYKNKVELERLKATIKVDKRG